MLPPGSCIIASAPLWLTASQFSQTLTEQAGNYSHTIEALGGFWSARFTIRANRFIIDDWLENGLGRHIEIYDHALVTIWEGFVNRLIVNYGPLSVSRGPLMSVANRVDLMYSTIETTTDPPTIGGRDGITTLDDADSQADWGILPKVLTAGNAYAGDADDIAATYLAEHKLPKTSKTWRNDTSTDTSVTVECLGYVHWLNYPFNDATTGQVATHTKIGTILSDRPNSSWLTYGTNNIDTSNTLTVPAFEDDNNLAWNIIKSIVAHGDTSGNRWTFGIYADQEAYYEAVPTTIEYQQRLGDPKVRVETTAGLEVYPWNVLPARWLLFPDFLIGRTTPSSLRDDPRTLFIERVTYRAPWGLDIAGGDTDTLPQLIAQYGLSGIGA